MTAQRRGMQSARAMTLIEVMIAVAIMGMLGLMSYGAIRSLSLGRKAEMVRADRIRQGREALSRITRELQSAYLTGHYPPAISQATRKTAFIGEAGSKFARLDFAAFAHRRVESGVPESDQAELGYFGADNPDAPGKTDLMRREQSPIDMEPTRGGNVDVLAEDIEELQFKYFDGIAQKWVDRWDSADTNGAPNRLPVYVHVLIRMAAEPNGKPVELETKVVIPLQRQLMFGVVPP